MLFWELRKAHWMSMVCVGKLQQVLATLTSALWEDLLTYLLPFLSWTTRAATNYLHLRWSWDSVRKVSRECPLAVASALTVRLHVIFGRPRFLRPSGFHSAATLGMKPWSLWADLALNKKSRFSANFIWKQQQQTNKQTNKQKTFIKGQNQRV